MPIIGLDDTDSRERGMCTTYVATRIARDLADQPGVSLERLLLVRLNPAVEYKTRGNAALAIHFDLDRDPLFTTDDAYATAKAHLERLAETADERTNPGLVVADHGPADVPETVGAFAREAIREEVAIAEAVSLAEDSGYRHWGYGNGRGRIGALAAIGAWDGLEEWTYECIAYREPARWGTPRSVDENSVFAAAEEGYPEVWDTVDRGEDETVCVPHTPGPILHGIRGDDPDAVRAVSHAIESEPVAERQLFVTNQGTDVHLRELDGDCGCGDADGHATAATIEDGGAYQLEGTVTTAPETRRGGHVFFDLTPEPALVPDAVAGSTETSLTLTCAAFEPTKRFRDRVRALRVGDHLTVCGELSRDTLKLEKFAVRDLVRTELVTPRCPSCDRRMKSAGRNQGYRCRECGTATGGKVERPLERDLEVGWYEVPPCARRHIAKPLVRGGFDGPTHAER